MALATRTNLCFGRRMKRLLPLLFLALVCSLATAQERPANQPQPPTKKQEAAKTYWITIKSGVRHNSNCRYYKNSNGRMCTKEEGRACKICGG